MKKVTKILFSALLVFALCLHVNAECNDEDLNEWATKVEPVFIENTQTGGEASRYAYFLTIDPFKGDPTKGQAQFRIVVYDGDGNKAEGEVYTLSDGTKIYGVGCFTNLEEETYTIEVYGALNGKCSNELLKKVRYTVPRFNRMVKSAKCENSQSELCKTFTNATKNMTEEEFEKKVDEDNGALKEKTTVKDILKSVLNLLLYIIIPLAVISVVYLIKIKKYKKEERKK